MTREEAIKELIVFKDKSWDGMSEEVIDVAIEALKQESCNDVLDKIRAEIKAMSGDIETIADALQIIDKYIEREERNK